MPRIVLIVLALLLSACAAVQPISDADRRKVASVHLHREVAKAPTVYYLGPGGASGLLMFGAIGGALAAGPIEEARTSFERVVTKNGVSIERIVLEEMEAAMRASGKFPLAAGPGPGGAVLWIDVYQYGFSIPNGFSSRLVPILGIRCEMKDAAGKVVWSASDRVLTLGNPVEPVEPEAIRDNPKVMEAAWRAAAKHIAAALVAAY